MQNILIIGAGRSAGSLISYLLQHATSNNWHITVGDINIALAEKSIAGSKNSHAILFDSTNEKLREEEIQKADVVVSMLPAFMHMPIANACVKFKKHLVTASYVSAEMQQLHTAAIENNIILLNEMGLDPGIDHMSAMKIIDEIKSKGGVIESFKSFCGGLIAPESNNNPWGYKFSWNPRNVVLAGQGTAQYIEHGEYKYIPYNRLFANAETITMDGIGNFDAYANRDSLSYRNHYGLENIKTMLRGTLRNVGYCKAWHTLVQLGLTDDTYAVSTTNTTYAQLIASYLPTYLKGDIKSRFAQFCGLPITDESINKVEWLGLFSDIKINTPNPTATPAQILQLLLEEKWKLQEHDKDMVVMQHQFIYTNENKTHTLTSDLVVIGEDNTHTAMAKTVGLPMGIAVKNILANKITERGVVIPTNKEVYTPILNELEQYGIKFTEKVN